MVEATTNNGNEDQTLVLDAQAESVFVGKDAFISDSDMSRDGFNLVLETQNGETVIIENYFAQATPPKIISEGDMVLTPQLVNSFLKSNLFAETSTTNDISPVGAVKELTGEATVTRTDGSVETITLETPIYEGDIVETGTDGAVNIVFIDETEFAVSEDARLAIDEYVFDPSTAEGTTNFSILRGVFVFTSGLIGRDDPDDVEIETPVGSIGIRGTIIAGKIDPEGGNNQITVMEGAIVIRNAFGETTISNQFETVTLSSFESEIVNIGTLDTTQMNESFGSVRGVSASLFSAMNNNSTNKSGAETSSEETTTERAKEGVEAQENGTEAGEKSSDKKSEQSAPDGTTANDPVTGETGLESKLDSTTSGLKTTNSTTLSTSTTNTSFNNTQDETTTTTQTQQTTTQESSSDDGTNDSSITESSDLTSPDALNNDETTGESPVGSATVIDIGSSLFSSRGLDIPTIAGANIGTSIAALGDIDADGRADFGFTGTDGKVFIYNSATNDVTHTILTAPINGTVNNDKVNIAGGGDFDADGNMDFIIGMPDADINGSTLINSGQIALFQADSTATANTITTDNGPYFTTGSIVGQDVAVSTDMNGDGFSDFALGFDENANGDGGLLIYKSDNDTLTIGLDTSDSIFTSGTGGEMLGISISDAGDINNDGYGDLIVGTLANRAYIVYGDDGAFSQTTLNGMAGVTKFGENVVNAGDMNRDGFSDILISSVGTNGEQVHLFHGRPLGTDPQLKTTFFTSRAGWEVNNAAKVGDFNGDGIDDFAISTTNHSNGSDIFVVYGRPTGFQQQIDLNFSDLNNFDGTLGMAMVWDNAGGQIELSGIGDVNGDGLDDLAIGASKAGGTDGAVKVVYGKTSPNIITDGDPRDGNTALNDIKATENGQSLLGNSADNILNGSGKADLSLSGGDGNDTLILQAAGVTHKTINGGGGEDRLVLTGANGVLDFTASGTGMSISNVEEIVLSDNSQTIKLTTADVFDLLQSSNTNSLKITSSGSTINTSNFVIDDPANTGNPSNIGFTAQIDTTTGAKTYDTWSLGGYTLYVDQDLAAQGIVV